MSSIRQAVFFASFFLLLASSAGRAEPGTTASAGEQFFATKVRPVLANNCFKCHAAAKSKGNLRLDSRAGLLTGGDSGAAIVPGKPQESLLIRALRYEGALKMPPSKKLSDEQIAAVTAWVKMGAPWPGSRESGVRSQESAKGKITDEARSYWAYKPVKRPAVPSVRNHLWVKTPVDAFILAKLEQKGLQPNPPANRVALVRRVYYDLTGLPPTPEQVDAFVNDKSADAYARLIDRLLDAPQYGEKWGRHWLDLVRFAETNGYERDGPKPFAWRYRDYVIKSFNDDKPYDRFLTEQLAGDEIAPDDREAIIATGFYRLGLWQDEPVDEEEEYFNNLDDIVATTCQVFLGMTMNCARCHDHKIDPLLQKDYYQMVAFFRDIKPFSDTRDVRSRFNLTDISPPAVRVKYERELMRREKRAEEITAAMRQLEDEAIKKMPAEDQRAAAANDRPAVVAKVAKFLTPEQRKNYQKLQADFRELRAQPDPRRDLALSVNNCLVTPPKTHVLVRGNAHAHGIEVQPAYPTVISEKVPVIPLPDPAARSSGRRQVLAQWIASRENPLTARVQVNRLWQHHFGRGIVASSNDFGKFGVLPTHPELLDWLADEFVAGGWKMKRMHKLIMLSNAYQMSAQAHEHGLKADAANALFWRFNMRRLTAEEIRDTLLAMSGQLNLKMGGPSIYPVIPKAVLAGQSMPGEGWGKSSATEAARRSVYVYIKRALLVPILTQYDQADTDSSCPVRYTTTVSTQALGMLNGAFIHEQAAAFAARLQREASNNLEAQVRRAIRLTTGRTAADHEVAKDLTFVRRLCEQERVDAATALRHYVLMMLNANELVYLD